MSLRINDEAPNFTAETTEGTLSFHDWVGDGWAILFSHPKDFTPVTGWKQVIIGDGDWLNESGRVIKERPAYP